MTGHEITVRVYYEDTDAAGIVYHASYLKFAERGRTELLRAIGLDHRGLAEGYGLLFAVAHCAVAFRRPARLDDLLRVRTSVTLVGAARLDMEQLVCRDEGDLARVAVTLAALDAASLRPKRLPAPLRAQFAAVASGDRRRASSDLGAIGAEP